MTAAALASALVPPPVLALAVKASVIARGDRRLEAENYLSDGYVLRQRIESIPGNVLSAAPACGNRRGSKAFR